MSDEITKFEVDLDNLRVIINFRKMEQLSRFVKSDLFAKLLEMED